MAVSDRMTGKDLYVGFIHSSGTADLSGDYRTLEVTREQEVADVSAGADAARAEKATLKTFGASLSVLYIGTAGSAVFDDVVLGAEGTLVYGPKGTTAGSPKGSFPAIVKSQPLSISYDGEVEVQLEFGPQGDEIENPFVDVWA